MAEAKVLKQYDIKHESIWGCYKWTLSQNGQTIYRSEVANKVKGILLDLTSADGTTILATVRPTSILGKTMHLSLGAQSEYPYSAELKCETTSQNKYSFTHLSRPYTWTRTHNKDLGGHKWGYKDYKLVDQISHEVLAAWSNNEAWFGRGGAEGKIVFFKELESDLEVLSLAAICRIEVFLRQQDMAASAASTAGASGAAGAAAAASV